MLKTVRLRPMSTGAFCPVDEWVDEDPRLMDSIQGWIDFNQSIGYDDIEECEVEVVRSKIVPDKVFSMDGNLFALKQEGVPVRVRKAKVQQNG